MRVAFWTPLPPIASGIADNSYELLDELNRLVAVTAVVDDAERHRAVAPPGIEIIAASAYRAEGFDIDLYAMGNHHRYHDFVHQQALQRPGILVLHDPSLADFYGAVSGGFESGLFLGEATWNEPELIELPRIEVRGEEDVDRVRLPMTRRLVDASLATIVHSEWAADEVRRRSPDATVVALPLTTPVVERPRSTAPRVVFGVFGSIARHKQVDIALEAFIEVHRDHPDASLVIAGYRDDPGFEHELLARVDSSGVAKAVSIRGDLPLDELEHLVASCDCVISLRWPTAGETSAIVTRALGAGRVVITTDLPQYAELSDLYCRKVAHEPGLEGSALVRAMAQAAADPEGTAAAGDAARDFVRRTAIPVVVAQRYVELVNRHSSLRLARATRAAELTDAPVRINAIASWASTTGLTESARRAVGALLDAGAEVSIVDHDFGAPREVHRFPSRLRQLQGGRDAPIDLCFLNVNELQVLSDDQLRPAGHRSYVIGYWYWELPAISRIIERQLRRVDEIWVASEFVAETFAQYTSAPIRVMPCVIEPMPDPTCSRSTFGIDEEACVFLFQFDVNSTVARKNPFGVTRAFREAFSHDERGSSVQLVMKTLNLEGLPEAASALHHEFEALGGVLIDDDLTSGEMAALVSCCDAFVSLHRAEGFGLGIAEAMYFGRPAIATVYSGNEDFCSVANSLPVGYSITPVTLEQLRFNPNAELIYTPGSLWAEPDLGQAARWMRLLYDNPGIRQTIGEAGKATIRTRFSAAAAGQAMVARLTEIERELGALLVG